MRKILSIIAASVITLSASAQGFVGNKFFDNWSLGIEVGGTTATSHLDQVPGSNKAFKQGAFWGGMRPIFGAELTKMISPAFGLAIQDHAGVNWTDSKTVVDYNDLVFLAKLNLMNFFGGYKDTPRTFELEGVLGVGWRYYFNSDHIEYINNGNPGTAYKDAQGNVLNNSFSDGRDSWITKAGLNFLFNLGEKKAWTLSVKPAIVWDMDGFAVQHNNGARFDINHSNIELMAGLTYHFKSSNGEHHFTLVEPCDPNVIDGLTSQINDLRNQLNDKDAQINNLNDENARLKEMLNKPAENTSVKEFIATPISVFFNIDKTNIASKKDLVNVRALAKYARENNSNLLVTGYADSATGSVKHNQWLSEQRAKVVADELVNNMGIERSKIKTAAKGGVNDLSPISFNRRATVQVTE
ncbi:OmpA family protein [Prevotella sp. S7 MS 2]|uniref:OmpA family protein n=1 Tax=Prevotella sp. S7 MS 2 TaxID=1287488 RepID=UPI0006900D28|nr:OmpA family protein [Prevotella sp. S7 MS 2]